MRWLALFLALALTLAAPLAGCQLALLDATVPHAHQTLHQLEHVAHGHLAHHQHLPAGAEAPNRPQEVVGLSVPVAPAALALLALSTAVALALVNLLVGLEPAGPLFATPVGLATDRSVLPHHPPPRLRALAG